MIPLPLYDNRSQNKSGKDCCAPQPKTCCNQTTADGKTVQNSNNAQSPIIKNKASWITGLIDTAAGPVPAVASAWSKADRRGWIRSRLGSYRMRYSIQPGLYAIGNPDAGADVFVSANYKLSFDVLRRELDGINGWILVLDTKGINVWCAAGKGTFGTVELVKQITAANLGAVVSHRRIIAPQLGAVGVKASEVKKRTGFAVLFGPIEAHDIKEYIGMNYKASPEMRIIKFTATQRLELTPMELNPALKKYPIIALIILILFGIEPSGIIFRSAWFNGWPFLLLTLAGIFTGAFATPVLLPTIPFRSFALKGALTGLIAAIPLIYFTSILQSSSGVLKISALIFTIILSSYLALQFTGSTTFTGISGVKKELKFSLPIYIAGLAVSLILIIIHKINFPGIL